MRLNLNRLTRFRHCRFGLGIPPKALTDLGWPDGNDYVTAFLQARDPKEVVDQIERLLGLAAPASLLPPTTAPVLSIWLIAELLARHAFDRGGLDVRSGYFDTSGMGKAGLRPELHLVPAIRSQLPACGAELCHFARRFWVIRRLEVGGQAAPKAIVDMRGICYSVHAPHEEVRFFVIVCPNLVADRLVYFGHNRDRGSWVIRDFLTGRRLDDEHSPLTVAQIEADAIYDEHPPWCNVETNPRDWTTYLRLRETAVFRHGEGRSREAPNPQSGDWQPL